MKKRSYLDHVGKKYDRLTVIKRDGSNKWNDALWECLCDCGNVFTTTSKRLMDGVSKSCGCIASELAVQRAEKRMIGKSYGRLVVESSVRINGELAWLCLCECGNRSKVKARDLNSGKVKSCGCLRSELVSAGNTVELIGKKYGRLTVLFIEDEKVVFKSTSKNKWMCICECGNFLTVTTGQLTSGMTKSCGCLKKELVGEKSPHYNPDVTDEEREKGRYELGGSHIVSWRKAVYERDDYTCQVCYRKGVYLNAHHLDGYSWCKDRRFDVSNGVTLCVACHKDFHKKHTRHNNTEGQFEEYKVSGVKM